MILQCIFFFVSQHLTLQTSRAMISLHVQIVKRSTTYKHTGEIIEIGNLNRSGLLVNRLKEIRIVIEVSFEKNKKKIEIVSSRENVKRDVRFWLAIVKYEYFGIFCWFSDTGYMASTGRGTHGMHLQHGHGLPRAVYL